MKALLGIAALVFAATGVCVAAQPGNDAPKTLQQVTPTGKDGETSETVLCVATYFEVRDKYPEGAAGYEQYMDESSFWVARLKKFVPDQAKAQRSVAGTRPLLKAMKDASPTALDATIRDCERAKRSLPSG